MAVPQAGTPGATFKQKAKGSHDQQGDMVQAATRTGASEHLGSWPGFAFGFQGSVFKLLMPQFLRSLLAATFVRYLKALWMGNTQQERLPSLRVQYFVFLRSGQ